MAAQRLPERPNLDHLKRQAKDLLHAARAKDREALARIRALPGSAPFPDGGGTARAIALHDAQSAIAREYGFASWRELSERVEELTLALEGAAAQLVEAATSERPDRAERLLALHPSIPRVDFHAALVLGDAAEVDRRLAADPGLATRRGGPRGWEPLHYLTYNALARRSGEREDGLLAIARRLLAAGADANLRYPWLHHDVHRPVLWGAVVRAGSLRLAEVLLDAGADPSDGVTLPLAAAAGNIAALELLHGRGADVDRPWASDGSAPLYAILHWATDDVGARWLLAHGADPDPVFAKNGETPLHVAAAGRDVALVEELVARGAAIDRPRADGRTPYVLAALNGNAAVAERLLARGASPELEPIDRLVAACSRGDRAAVDATLRAQPGLRASIQPGHYPVFLRAAERGEVPAVRAMLACGFDPNRGDESIGKTALHAAAAGGQPGTVQALLDGGAAVDARDAEFKATPLVWAAEHARLRPDARDFARVGRLLIDAGSPQDWKPGEEPADALSEILEAWRLAAEDRSSPQPGG